MQYISLLTVPCFDGTDGRFFNQAASVQQCISTKRSEQRRQAAGVWVDGYRIHVPFFVGEVLAAQTRPGQP